MYHQSTTKEPNSKAWFSFRSMKKSAGMSGLRVRNRSFMTIRLFIPRAYFVCFGSCFLYLNQAQTMIEEHQLCKNENSTSRNLFFLTTE